MEIIHTPFEGLVVLKPNLHLDNRGYFFESFSQRDFESFVAPIIFVQDNEVSSKYGVIRAFGFQIGDNAQSKLIRCVSGKILDVVIDVRKDSATFGQSYSIELSNENRLQLFIPKGFAHGYSVLEDNTIINYKTDEYYNPQAECSFLWNDPNLDIDWKLDDKDIIVSSRDAKSKSYKEVIKSLFI